MEEIIFLHIFRIIKFKNKYFRHVSKGKSYDWFELGKPVAEFKHSEVGKPLADFTMQFQYLKSNGNYEF